MDITVHQSWDPNHTFSGVESDLFTFELCDIRQVLVGDPLFCVDVDLNGKIRGRYPYNDGTVLHVVFSRTAENRPLMYECSGRDEANRVNDETRTRNTLVTRTKSTKTGHKRGREQALPIHRSALQ